MKTFRIYVGRPILAAESLAAAPADRRWARGSQIEKIILSTLTSELCSELKEVANAYSLKPRCIVKPGRDVFVPESEKNNAPMRAADRNAEQSQFL